MSSQYIFLDVVLHLGLRVSGSEL